MTEAFGVNRLNLEASRATELISEREHIKQLLARYSLWQLCAKLTEGEGEGSAWRLLADKLGLTVDQIAAAVSQQPDNPGYGVMTVWSKRRNSTIGILRKILAEELKREDLVDILDKARQNVVSTTVYIESENEPEIDLSGKCPGDTTLIDYVRRKVQRKLGLRLMQHDRQTVLQMIRTGNCNWTSTVDEFKGQEIRIQKTFTTPREEVKSDPAMPHRRRRVERHAVSDSNNDIIFELVDDDNDDECLSSSSGDEVQQHQEENPSATKQLV